MLRIGIRFPLGVYNARSATDAAEWPPSPLRLVGALLAAAHGRHGADTAADCALLQRLCEAPAPHVLAPDSVAVGEPVEADEVVRLRGATRWAPRNYVSGPLSPRNVGRDRAPVSKAGVAIGDRPVAVVWPHLELDDEDLRRLAVLASDVTCVGTTRSPAILEVDGAHEQECDGQSLAVWTPAAVADRVEADAAIRVPDAQTIVAFDRRHDARRGNGARVQRAGMVPEIAIGTSVPYVSPRRLRSSGASPFDPRWWGEMIVLEIDRERSEVAPRAAAAYLLARAFRVALLGAFGEVGTAEEAPPILRARDADPHCAIVPLPSVWGQNPDGRIRGVALLLPNEARAPDVYAQLPRVELGLRRLVERKEDGEARHISIPGAGRIWLKLPDAHSARLMSLREASYRGRGGSSSAWVSVTPIVHSRWRKRGVDALLRQVSADCAHVGLSAPTEIQLLRAAGRRGGADKAIPAAQIPAKWRGLLNGPTSHLRMTFSQPVCGPVLIGRARHFGLGLCIPDTASADSGSQA
ncbi:MAG TPA: type I-U CRISPR-associated protein Csb2 [Solirubrobacteraceae bacterium]|nr:type I-U CRISPR-associated protein Csb2 [Solirubrobacteraceae bacterium]